MSWRGLARVASWLLLGGLLVIGARAVPWREAVSASATASGQWLAAATLVHALILPLGTLQWMCLIPRGERIAFRTMLWIRSAGWAIANGGPFLAEHAASIHLLAKRGGVGYVAATSIKILDQVTTGAGKLMLLGAVLVAAAPLPPTLRATAGGLVAGVGALWLSLVACVGSAARLERWAARRERMGHAVIGFLARLSRHLEVVRSPRSLGLGSFAAVAQRAAETAACWAVVSALGGSISLAGALLVAMAVNLSTMMSITPANLGVFEGSAFVALRASGLPAEQAVAAAVLLHVSYLLPIAGVGWTLLASATLRQKRRPRRAQELSGTPRHR
jgi:uncharacterized protein (TIRG00374 family)